MYDYSTWRFHQKSFCKLTNYWISFIVPIKQTMNVYCYRKPSQVPYSCVCLCACVCVYRTERNSGRHFLKNRGRVGFFLSHNHFKFYHLKYFKIRETWGAVIYYCPLTLRLAGRTMYIFFSHVLYTELSFRDVNK